jgi:hypothetical protein
LEVTPPPALLPQAQDLEVTWTGGDPTSELDIRFVKVRASQAQKPRCIAATNSGHATLPGSLLYQVQHTGEPTSTFSMEVTTHARRRLDAAGFDVVIETEGYGSAVQFDALSERVAVEMTNIAVAKAAALFHGRDFERRSDPMHFQGRRVDRSPARLDAGELLAERCDCTKHAARRSRRSCV